MSNLYSLVKDKKDLESNLEDCLTYTEELEKIWRDNEIAIKAKIDSYGYVLDEIDSKIDFIKRKEETLKELRKKLEKETDNIKRRLNMISQEIPLEGNEYRFKPYNSVNRTVDIYQVEPELKRYIVNMDYKRFQEFESMVNLDIADNIYTYTTKVNVTDLPEDHPAIVANIAPTVRRLK